MTKERWSAQIREALAQVEEQRDDAVVYLSAIKLVLDVVARGQIIVMLSPTPSPVLDPRTRAETEARVQAARARVAAAESSVESADARRRAAATRAGGCTSSRATAPTPRPWPSSAGRSTRS